jgi:tetratricopeptide (TPR) repeat protein
MLLSAALIVRDEAAVLADCLQSIQNVCDEIIVVDTGSTDRSMEIASSFGARVVQHEWSGDFSEARNVSLDLVSGRWVLYIDADERLVDCDRSDVEDLLGRSDAAAFRVLLRPYVGSTAYREYRIWRSDPRIRFTGFIHETMLPALEHVAVHDSRPILDADITIQHVGYEGDQTHKHVRNLPLLLRQSEQWPQNLFVRHHLARVLDALGQSDEAERALVAGLELTKHRQPADPLGALLYAETIRHRMRRGADCTSVLREALEIYPDNLLFLFFEGRRLIDRECYAEALEQFDQMLEFGTTAHLHIGRIAYDQGLASDLPYEGRALCLFRLGRFSESAASYEAASRCAPENRSYRVKQLLAQSRAR